MTDTFTWQVHADAGGNGEFATAKAQFGDGYAQEVPLGLNSESQKWTVNFSGYAHQVAPVLAFIRAHKGMSFLWKPPLGTQGLYKCKKYNINPQSSTYYVLSMEFEQAFAP